MSLSQPLLHLQKLLSVPTSKKLANNPHVLIWFIISLVIAAYFGILSLKYLFGNDYIVQDDARHYVFWMHRFVDSQLFPNDLIADYYQTVTPIGYANLFRWMAKIGVEPSFLMKVLPLVIGLITSAYCFFVCLELFSIPVGAFIATLILNQALWLRHDIVATAPKAFLYPFCFAFIYYLLKQKLIPLLFVIALQGLFYPSSALVEIAVLIIRLLRFNKSFLRFSPNKNDYVFWLTGSSVALIVLLAYTPELTKFGPIVTLAQAKAMPEFGPEGRIGFFAENPLKFWLTGDSGIHFPAYPPIIWSSLLLPILLSYQLPLTKYISNKVVLLTQILLASLGLFFLAHLVLLKLYYPARYTEHSLIVVMALASAIALVVLLDVGIRWLIQQQQTKTQLTVPQRLVVGFVGVFLLASLIVPGVPSVVSSAYDLIVGKAPQLYEFLQQHPKDTLTASVSEQANNLPSFAKRSVLVAREYALPYHVRYYTQIRQRAVDLINAQYSPDLQELQQFIQKYGVDYFLLDHNAFTPDYLEKNSWLQQYQPATTEAIKRLQHGKTPVLSKLAKRCSVLETRGLTLVEAKCIKRQFLSRD